MEYKVWDYSIDDYRIVNDEWMENVDTKNAVRYEYSTVRDGMLTVTYEYKNGSTSKVQYINLNGSWGQPTTIV